MELHIRLWKWNLFFSFFPNTYIYLHYRKEGFSLNKKYVLKGLLLIILIPIIVYYFLKTSGSEVTISSIFILIFTILGLYDEITLSKNNSVNRNTYQLIIDRLLVLVLIVISMDVLIAFFANGITI